MNELEIGIEDDHIVISMNGKAVTGYAKLTEDEALATAMVILGQVITLRKRRNMQ